MTESTKKEILEQVKQLMELINSNVPDGYGTFIDIGKDNHILLDIRKWEEPDENGDYQGSARRDLLTASFFDGEWGEDQSEYWNTYYRNNGILLEDDPESEKRSA